MYNIETHQNKRRCRWRIPFNNWEIESLPCISNWFRLAFFL